MNCYDLQSCIGTIRAAERLRAPAIIEVRVVGSPSHLLIWPPRLYRSPQS